MYRKKGGTPVDTGDIVTLKFDQMQDTDIWTWMEVRAWADTLNDTEYSSEMTSSSINE